MIDTGILPWALWAAEANGWRVLPVAGIYNGVCACKDGAECPSKPGKHPLVPGWQNLASSDPKQITAWWRRHPLANLGIATGPGSGFWVLDIDGDVGRESLALLEQEHGRLPDTLRVRTGSGGLHYYFAWPPVGLTNKQKLRPGIDVRGNGGQVLAPPSAHISGKDYAFENLETARIVPAPQWLLAIINPAPKSYSNPPPLVVEDEKRLSRARAYIQRMEGAISGSAGHSSTFLAAQVLCVGFALGESEALHLLLAEYNPKCKPPWTERELRHKISQARQKSRLPLGFLLKDRRRSFD